MVPCTCLLMSATCPATDSDGAGGISASNSTPAFATPRATESKTAVAFVPSCVTPAAASSSSALTEGTSANRSTCLAPPAISAALLASGASTLAASSLVGVPSPPPRRLAPCSTNACSCAARASRTPAPRRVAALSSERREDCMASMSSMRLSVPGSSPTARPTLSTASSIENPPKSLTATANVVRGEITTLSIGARMITSSWSSVEMSWHDPP
mmetsp:Transcript_47891/g.153472  ORF Transcript_47891/g.153472 Transcript_47891/m.153472 type:complete len:214 (+) Transcript_47891:1038-1679(+)